MKKSERLKPRIKIKFKYFILTHILTLFFALAPASPAGWPIALAAGNFFDFNQESPYSEPFSKLIEFLNEKKKELEKYDGDFLSEKVLIIDNRLRDSKSVSDDAAFNPASSSFVSAVFESVKSFVVDNPKQYFGTVFESVKNFVFPGPNQNGFEYNSPSGESARREMENLKQQYAEAIDEAKSASQKFSLLQNEMDKIKNSGVVVRQPVIEQRTVEKTIEKIVSGLSQTDLDSGLSNLRTELNNLNTNLLNQINTLSASTNRQTSAVYQAVSLTNKIDSLTNTTLTTPTISNPTITGILTNQTLSNSGNATIGGTFSVSGLATFANSTTTNATITDNFWSNGSTRLFGGQAYIGDEDSDALTIRSGVWSLTSAATSTVAMTNGLNFDSNTFVIDPNANRIGIGTSSPYAKLSVVGPVVAEYFHATSTAATSTFSGQAVAGFAPTLAHSFGSWSVGAAGANPLGASFIINPSSAASDSNLLSLSVSGSAKFLVDAEGDVFANAVTVVGGTTLSTTTASTFTVENNTNLGDATTTDITYFNSRIADSLIPTADNLLDLGDSANWLRWRTGYFGTSVGIGGTATSTGTQLTTSGAYLIDSGNTLSINTTNNKAVSFGTGNVVLPYGSSTALTVSGSAYIGSLNGPLQANNGLVSATTSVGSIYGGTGIDSSALTGIAQIVAGTWSASSTLSTAFGGTGWGNLQANTVLLGNGAGRLATTTAGTDGYVLALSAGVPTWLATSTLSTITGTLTVAKGGTGQTSFGQGWLNSNGTTLTSSTSPTVAYITATSTTATSTFPYLSVTTNSNLGTVVGGTWQGTAVGAQYGGTGQNFSASSGLVNFYSGTASAIATSSLGLLTTNVAEGTNLYWTNDRFDTRLSATTTLPNLTTLLGLTNATTTGLTTTNSWLGTIRSGTWNGTAISNQYGGTGLDSSALTGIAQIVSGTWSASSTLSTAFGGTGWGNLQANTVLLGNGAGRLATTSAGTDGYVLALSSGVPTWLATSTLSTITGTLAVGKGGTGQTSFGQGWLNSNGTDLSASTSPTINYIVATSTTATSTFPYLSVTTNSNLGTVVGGTWQGTAVGDAYLTKSGDWTGTLDTYEASSLLARANHTGTQGVSTLSNYDWTFSNNYGAINLTGSSTKPIWAQGGINASSTSNFVYASTTALTVSGNSYLGTVSSGVWNGAAIGNSYLDDDITLTNLTQITNRAITDTTGTLTVARGGTGQTSFSQGWLNSDGTTLSASTSPTVNYIIATSTTATSTFAGGMNVAGSSGLTVLQNGNVGVGTTGPGAKLHIRNSSATSGSEAELFRIEANAAGDGSGVVQEFRDSDIRAQIAMTDGTGSYDSRLEFRTANGSSLATPTTKLIIDNNGNVGIGTTSPSQLLSVAGHCVTGDTRLRRRRRRKKKDGSYEDVFDDVRIDEIKEGDEILTLDDKTGLLKVSRVKKLMYMGSKPIIELVTASGKKIRTTGNHPYLIKTSSPEMPKKKPRLGIFFDDANMFYAQRNAGWWVDIRALKQALAKQFNIAFLNYYIAVPERKDPASEQSALFMKYIEREVSLITKPLKYIAAENGVKKKGDMDVEIAIDVTKTIDDVDAILVVSGDSDLLPLRKYAIERDKKIAFAGFRHNMAWELTKFAKYLYLDGMRIYLSRKNEDKKSKNKNSEPEPGVALLSLLYSRPPSLSSGGVWTKAEKLKIGQDIAVLGKNGKAAWDKIAELRDLPLEDVYDIEVEGTHNFIGNDIVAHNTYLTGGLGAGVVEATNGNITGTGRLSITSTTATSTFSTGGLTVGTNQFVVQQTSGNVGIGTTLPGVKLTVQGGAVSPIAKFTRPGSEKGLYLVTEGNANFHLTSEGSLALRTNYAGGDSGSPETGTLGIYIKTDGNVGIGEVAPGSLLHISGNVSNNAFLKLNNTSTSRETSAFQLLSEGALRWSLYNDPAAANVQLFSIYDEVAGSNRLVIDSSGNVGIGTTTPGSRLSVTSGLSVGANYGVAAPSNGAIIEGNVGIGTTAIQNAGVEIGNNGKLGFSGTGYNAVGKYLYVPSDGALQWEVGGGGTPYFEVATGGVVKHRLNTAGDSYFNGGNVGIGTTSPGVKLHVYSPAGGSAPGIRLQANDNLTVDLDLFSSGVTNGMTIRGYDSVDGAFKIRTSGGTDRLVISSTGNVGIGTTTPNSLLHIAGANVATEHNVFGNLAVITNTTQAADIGGSITLGGATNGTGIPLTFAAISGRKLNSTVDNNSGYLAFETELSGTGLVERMRIDNNGNVGIGTTTPAKTLHVQGTTLLRHSTPTGVPEFYGETATIIGNAKSQTFQDNLMILDYGSATLAGSGGAIAFGGRNSSAGAIAHGGFIGISKQNSTEGNTGYDLILGARNNGEGVAEKMRIMGNGNVGIGTTTPAEKLDVVGGNVRIFNNGGNPALKIGDTMSNSDDSGDNARLAWDSIADRFSIGTWDGGLNTLVINKTGNVGIGTTTPAEKLDVSGTGNINVSIDATGGNGAGIYFKSSGRDTWQVGNSIAVASRFDVTDTSTGSTGVYLSSGATSWTSNSDIRLKTNITNISNALERLNRIRGVNFNWIDPNANSGAQIGVIAQEVESVFPEIVDTQGEYWGVQYEKLSPILVEAVNELNAKVDLFASSTIFSSYLVTSTSTPAMLIDVSGNVGIGTTSPAYKLQVMGDIAATSFINTSTKQAKKDIAYLSSSQEEDFLDKIKNTSLANYHYNIESENNPLRLGLIAEEAPSEILSVDGKGVDVYKMATFTLGGVKALQKEIEKMKIDLTALSASAGASSGQTSDSLFSWITDKFKAVLGIGFEQGKICLEDVCVNKTQLKELLEKNNISSTSSSSSSSSSSSISSSSSSESSSSASEAGSSSSVSSSEASSSESSSSSSSPESSSSSEASSSSSSSAAASELSSSAESASSSSEPAP